MNWLKHLFLYSFLLSVFISEAQQYNFINYNVEDGLAQSQVTAITQGNLGYLWIGTRSGLSRFDGKNFQNFFTENGLPDNQITSLFKDKYGNIWIGTLGHLSKFDGKTFTNFELPSHLSNNFIISIAEHNNSLWVGTEEGVCQFKDNSFTYYNEQHGITNLHVRDIFSHNKNDLYLITKNGIFKLKNDSSFVRVFTNLPNQNFSKITQQNNEFIVSTFGNGVYKVKDDSVKNLSTQDGLCNEQVRWLISDSKNQIWVASKSGVSKVFENEVSTYTINDGMVNDNVKVIFEDREGNIWFGTDGSGILKFTSDRITYFSQKDLLPSDIVMSIAQDNEENYWIGTYGNGIVKKTTEGVINYTTSNGLSNNTVWYIYNDSQNRVWIATSDGVTIFNENKIKNISTNNGLISKKVWTINEGNNGNIWLGTLEGISIITKNDSIINFPSGQNSIGESVRGIIKYRNTFWFATSNGVYYLNKSTEEFIKKKSPFTKAFCIEKDHKNNLWVGTDEGLFLFKDDDFSEIKFSSDLRSKQIVFLKFDKTDNSLWIGTNNGVFQLSLPEFYKNDIIEVMHYTKQDGLPSLECNQNAIYIDLEENLWAGTSKGLVKFSNTKFKSNLSTPILSIRNVRLFLENNSWSNFQQDSLGLPMNLKLNFKQNYLSFDFIGIYHSGPDKVQYKFMLEGLDEGWLPTTDISSATYSNLPHGNYTFKVISSVNDFRTYSEAKFSFTILTPYYLTWWFISISILFGLSILFGVYSFRKKARRQKEHTQQLYYRSKMLALEQQTLNSSMNRHFIFNSLNSIQYYINTQDRKSANLYLSSFAKLIRKNLDSSESNTVTLEEEIDRLSLYLKLEKMRFTDKFDYTIDIDKSIISEQIKIPAMLLQPFVENSIWHGILPKNEKGSIVIRVSMIDKELIKFEIIDDGIGIEESIKNKQQKSSDHVSKGMNITKNRLKLIAEMTNKPLEIIGPEEIKDGDKVLGTKVEIIVAYKEF
jgi:ligand-binding sensor domain-containing protein/two-component sensor histidine kinase